MKYFICFLLLLPFFHPPVIFATENSYQNVQYLDNYDGDTITVDIPGASPLIGEKIHVRLRGVDTPELAKGKCQEEKRIALLAKNRVHSLLKSARVINLHHVERGKYFRILADVEFDGKDLASILLKEDLAIPYSGGTRSHDWCNGPAPLPAKSTQQGPAILPPIVEGVYVWPPPPTQE